MPCYISETEGGRMFICGELGPHCAECMDVSGYLCDFPVGEDKTCDRPVCHTHANPIGPDLHYCTAHFMMWKEYKESGGVSRELENVYAFGKPKPAGGGE